MSWTKRDPVQNMVFLGDGEGDRSTVGGLLVDVSQNKLYPQKVDYHLVQKTGEVYVLGGSASLNRQLGVADVGKFIKCAFKGWGKSANGKFKEIEVNVWDGPISPEMKAWPQYSEFEKPKAAAGAKSKPTDDGEGFPAALADEEDDGLPF